jgi:hypothetical protein
MTAASRSGRPSCPTVWPSNPRIEPLITGYERLMRHSPDDVPFRAAEYKRKKDTMTQSEEGLILAHGLPTR